MGNRDINKMRIVDELGVWNENCNSDINLNMCNSTDGNISLPYHGGVYWLRGTGLIGDPLKQDDVVVTNSTSTRNNENTYDNQRRLWHTTATCETNAVPSETAAERLKWMLRKTMGSVDAFELRRSELERERLAIMNASSAFSSCSSMEMGQKEGPGTLQIDVENKMRLCVSDEEVARSYILSCDPVSGIMSQYLSRAKLMIRFGPALFLHGALPFTKSNNLARTSNDTSESLLDSEMKFDYPTPWAAQSASKSEQSLTEWIGESNSFAESQVKAWKDYATSIRAQNSIQQHSQGGIWATEGGYFNSTPGGKMFGALLQFGMGTLPNRSKNPSVVYNSWMRGGMPRNDLFGGKALERLMKKEGLQTIVSGHQPVGDMPWPIQVSFGRGFKESINRWVLPCDTSFSGDTNWALVEGSMSEKRDNLGRGLGQSGRGKVSCW